MGEVVIGTWVSLATAVALAIHSGFRNQVCTSDLSPPDQPTPAVPTNCRAFIGVWRLRHGLDGRLEEHERDRLVLEVWRSSAIRGIRDAGGCNVAPVAEIIHIAAGNSRCHGS